MHIFFIQLEPDIDHASPIVYQLAKLDPNRVMMICMNPLYDIQRDFRLRYLKHECGVKSAYIHEVCPGWHFRHRLMRALLLLPRWVLRRFPQKIWQFFYFSMMTVSRKKVYRFFQSTKPESITMDEAFPQKSSQALVEAARALNIPIVTFPSSCAVHQNPNLKPIDLSQSDYCILPHALVRPRETFNSQVKFLGCPRYADTWQNILTPLLQAHYAQTQLPHHKGKLKVLIFGRQPVRFRRGHPTIKRIFDLDFVTPIFKHKPRSVIPTKLVGHDVSSYPSAHLIQWADVVVCSVTSIVLDVLYHKKVLIYPKHVAPHDTGVFEDYHACWKVDSDEELVDALRQIYAKPGFKAYSDEDVKCFYSDSVYAGNRNQDIMDMHEEFYQTLAGAQVVGLEK